MLRLEGGQVDEVLPQELDQLVPHDPRGPVGNRRRQYEM